MVVAPLQVTQFYYIIMHILFYYIHCNLSIALYALCSAFYAVYYMDCIQCIAFDTLIFCILSYALYFIYYILCIVLHFYCIILFFWSEQSACNKRSNIGGPLFLVLVQAKCIRPDEQMPLFWSKQLACAVTELSVHY